MGRQRPGIPRDVETAILTQSARRCCLCYGLKGDLGIKKGQIAHLDGDRTNNDPDNLAFLCLDDHDGYDSRTSQSKNVTLREVKHYRAELYARVAPGLDPAPSAAPLVSHSTAEGGSIIVSQGQTGGQTAHAITNYYGLPPQADAALDRTLRTANLSDERSPDFGSTKYSQHLAWLERQTGRLYPFRPVCVLFALAPGPLVSARQQDEVFRWINANDRRYPPAPNECFIPTLQPEIMGKGYVWHDGLLCGHVPGSAAWMHYLAIEAEGYVEYGFATGSLIDPERDHVYYAKVIARFVMFLGFLRELAAKCGIPPGSLSLGLALRGIRGSTLSCISERVLRHSITTRPPDTEGLLHLRRAGSGQDWTVDDVAREAAGEILARWSCIRPGWLGVPEFEDGRYTAEFYRKHAGAW